MARNNIWKLHIAPWAKIFLWMVFHGKIPTYDYYLYALKLGPPNLCFMWSKHREQWTYFSILPQGLKYLAQHQALIWFSSRSYKSFARCFLARVQKVKQEEEGSFYYC